MKPSFETKNKSIFCAICIFVIGKRNLISCEKLGLNLEKTEPQKKNNLRMNKFLNEHNKCLRFVHRRLKTQK